MTRGYGYLRIIIVLINVKRNKARVLHFAMMFYLTRGCIYKLYDKESYIKHQ